MGLFSLNTAKILAKAKKCLEKKDYDFALIELKRIEKEYHAPEHPEVLFLMGKIYYLKDENQKAFEYVKRASYVEYPDAMNYLAAFYMSGIGTEINYGESLKWARRAISKGIEDSKQALQNIRDMAKIDEDWDWELTLEKISEEIHSEEEKNLKEFSAHVAFCWVGAEDGYVEAQYLLGLIYYTGRRLTVDCDYEEACYWFKKAADKKHGKATYYLARIYEERLYRSDASLFLCKDLKPIEDLYIKAHDLGVEETEGCFVYPHMLQKFIYNLTEKYTIAQKDAVFERLVESFVNDEDIGKGLNAEEKNAQLVSLQGYLYGLRDYKAYLAKAYEEE